MLTKKDLGEMQDYDSAAGRILSVYLDIDQSDASNLNRGFECTFEAKVQDIDRIFDEEYERRDFATCLAEVRKLLATYEPHGRGLVVFAKSTGPVWFRELNVPATLATYPRNRRPLLLNLQLPAL